jgi:hypothetical protein
MSLYKPLMLQSLFKGNSFLMVTTEQLINQVLGLVTHIFPHLLFIIVHSINRFLKHFFYVVSVKGQRCRQPKF